MPEYTHTLIPAPTDFAPDPAQTCAFLAGLAKAGAAPLDQVTTVAKNSGEVRTYVNPFTRKPETFPWQTSQKVNGISEAQAALKGLDNYEVEVDGKGPPKLPALKLDFKKRYAFAVRCCLRPKAISTSDWHDDVAIERAVEFFGRPCNPDDRMGIFHNPETLAIIEVPLAGCARFWIEFELGKSLFPKFGRSLDLFEPAIVQIATDSFGVGFVQGCRWCA